MWGRRCTDEHLRVRMLLLAPVVLLGCALSHGRGEPAPARDAGHHVAPRDAGTDARPDPPSTPDAGPACIPTAEAEMCDGRDEDCDGFIDEDALCLLPNAVAECREGACVFASCEPGFADCDDDDGNGCEVDLQRDRASCGACGHQCRVSEACVDGMCEREEIVDLAYAKQGHIGCVVLASGRLVCWGRNEYRAIASETVEDQPIPVEVDGIDEVQQAAVSIGMICALRRDGSVWCRGGGELGIEPAWRVVEGLVDPVQVVAGRHHFCALQSGGEVACWGKHLPFGALGLGADGPAITWTPSTPVGLPTATMVAADDANGCAADGTGVVRCWGELPIGTRTGVWQLDPIEMIHENGARWVTHSYTHGCFIDASDLLQCFGEDRHGGLGVGRPTFQRAPVVVSELGAVRDAWISPFLNTAITLNHRVFWWGRDPTQPFDPFVRPTAQTPQHVSGFDGALRAVMGQMVICAQMTRLSVKCMGWNLHGAVGDGSVEDRPEPVPVLGFE